jgi:O-antigen/teichoic acid export membrane protein
MSRTRRTQMLERLGEHAHLVRGSFGVMLASVITSATGWLFWAIAAHRWTASAVGVATSLVAAMTLISLIAGQPIVTTLLTRLPRSQNRVPLLRAAVILSSAIALACCVPTLLVLPGNLNEARTFGIAPLFLLGAVAGSLGIILDGSALSVRRPQLMVARNAGFGTGKMVLLGVLAIRLGLVSGPFAVMISWVAVSCAACLWAARSWTKGELKRARERTVPAAPAEAELADPSGWRVLRRGFGAQVLGVLGGTLPPQILPILVITRLGTTAAGWFSITWLVGGLCFMISPSICQALLAEGSLRPEQLRSKTVAAVALSGGLLFVPVLVYVFAGRFVLDLFGSAYGAHGASLLAILAVSSIPDMVTNVAVSRFRIQQRLWEAALVNVSIALAAVAGTWWALPVFGVASPGWVWGSAQCLGCLVFGAIALRSRAVERGGALARSSSSPGVA